MADTAEETREILRRIGTVLDTASNGRTYSNRSGVGYRVYADVRLPAEPVPDTLHAWSGRVHDAIEQEGRESAGVEPPTKEER